MPWNEPGSNERPKPWEPEGNGNGGRRGGGSQQPPDLDEIVRKLQTKFNDLLGGGDGRGSNGGSSGRGTNLGGIGLLGIGIVLLGLWIFSGFYVVEQPERSVELMFGKFNDQKEAGLRWHIPYPIETVEIVNSERVNTVEVGYRQSNRANLPTTKPIEALMLTQDENIIDIQFAVQYNIKDPQQLLFNVSEAPLNVEEVVRQATESAVREVVGQNEMDFVITGGRAEIASRTKDKLQVILDRYETGINVQAVEMQNAQPPEQVKDAFDDAVRAREDQERLKNEAQAYSNDVIPRARGQAARIVQEAEGYRAAVLARAEGEASRFSQVLTEYSKAPEITRDRLYLESMEQVLSNSSKLMIDQKKGGNNILYLPLEQMINQRRDAVTRRDESSQSSFANDLARDATAGDGRNTRSTGRTGRGNN